MLSHSQAVFTNESLVSQILIIINIVPARTNQLLLSNHRRTTVTINQT